MRQQKADHQVPIKISSDRADEETREEILSGGGELGARIRAFDWSTTPMGPISTWPQSFKTAVRILITSRYAMWLGWGPDLTFLYNDAYAHMTLGKKHPWALGRPAREVWAEIWADLDPRIQTVFETGEATWDEGLLLFLERSGYPEETYHTFSYSPLTSDNGKINGLLCVVTEETERIIGARQLGSLRSLAGGLNAKIAVDEVLTAAESSLEGNQQDLPFALIYLFEKDGTRARLACATGIATGHPAAPETIETNTQQEVWPIRDLMDQRDSIVVENLTERFGEIPTGAWDKAPASALLVAIPGQGQDIPAGVLIAALNPYRQLTAGYSGFIGLVAGQIAAGIASARAYEDERKRAEALAAIDKSKTAFFSNVSHEFRTPLTLMLGPTEDALARAEKTLRGSELETVHRNQLRLLKLVNTLLDFSRLEAGRVKASYHATDLSAYTAELASVFGSAMDKAGLSYVVECEPLPEPVHVDHEMWEKIVLNLISNALKSTFDGSISVRMVDKSDHAELRVQDTGTGIPEHEIGHLFERFRRIENARRRTHEGSGIGLALVHELLNMHGGKISVQSEVGKGTVFSVSIPYGTKHLPQDRLRTQHENSVYGTSREAFVQEALSWLPGQTDPDDPEQYTNPSDLGGATGLLAEKGEKARVLLVDDNHDMREYVRRLLSSRFRVITAENGADALRKAKIEAPDLVLSDVMMPEMDGFQLLHALRENHSTSAVPVVLLSARAGEDALVEGMQSGADDYLIKPFTARELLARVEAHTKMARFRREAEAALRASELRFRRLIERANVGVAIGNLGGRITYLNPNMLRLLGYQVDDVRNGRLLWSELTPPEFAELDARATQQLKERGACDPYEKEYLARNGRRIPLLVGATMIMGAGGAADEVAMFLTDLTGLKRTEEALHASETRLNAIYSSMHEYIGLLAADGTILDCNPALLQFAGNRREEVIGLKFWESPWFIYTPGAPEQLRQAIAHTAAGEFMRYEIALTRPSGEVMTFDFSLRPVHNEQGEVSYIVPEGRDITELKRAQSALMQSEKLAAVGRLSASIAHEINNPLEAVTNLLYLIEKSDDLPESLHSFTRMAQQELARVGQIATQTLRFYRQPTARTAVRVPELLDSVLKLFQGRLVAARVEVVTSYANSAPLTCFEGELRQVFTNLIGNAMDALRTGGQILLREREATDWSTGRKGIRVTVSDNGHGMSPETLTRIFEPFFSTKGNTGTGLGLWVSLGIIQKHKGRMKVRSCTSQRRHGTTFSIFLPHSEQGIAESSSAR